MAQSKTRTEGNGRAAGSRRASDDVTPGFPPDMATFFPAADGMRMGADSIKHWFTAAQDMARFYNERIAKDFGYMTELGTCRSPAQFTAVWCRAASETAHDYAEQLDRVLAINLNGADTLDPS
jgi:hypothetical protein